MRYFDEERGPPVSTGGPLVFVGTALVKLQKPGREDNRMLTARRVL
jgi:hypothetical protein